MQTEPPRSDKSRCLGKATAENEVQGHIKNWGTHQYKISWPFKLQEEHRGRRLLGRGGGFHKQIKNLGDPSAIG